MKKIFVLLLMVGLLGIYSCEDYFLQKPDTSGTVDLNAIYGSAENAKAALMSCYRSTLIQGWPGGMGIGHGALASISGERSRGYSWHGTYKVCAAGLTADGTTGDGSGAGADNYGTNWSCIRSSFLVKENIDKVPDMTEEMKGYIKAECTGLIAYRYMGMFYRYGGVPIVTKSFEATDDLSIPRATLQETLDYIIRLCDEAYAGLPNNWSENQTGRLTKGAVLAMKSKALMFAARPLFNSATPYLDNGEHNDLICFGEEKASRWQDAITANEAVLTWAAANGYALINSGGAGTGMPNPNAIADYGNAVSTPGNKETILAYKCDITNQYTWPASAIFYYLNMSRLWTNNRWDTDKVGLLTNFLENYYRADGTEQSWPKVGDAAPRPISDWLERVANMEPRFKTDHIGPGFQAAANPGVYGWTLESWNRSLGNYGTSASTFPNSYGDGAGCAFSTKFYYNAGSRVWFEPPLFRLAETYLNLAEAYNEANDPTNALKNLNMVHNRAGLPSITERDKTLLRGIIQREKAIEYYNENHRYYDVKHWKLSNIANGIIGGQMRELQFRYTSGLSANLPTSLIEYWDCNAYVSYWSPKMYLEPIPLTEINKGVSIQNPGY